jgi:aldehyde dehydrogenase (NAD+)
MSHQETLDRLGFTRNELNGGTLGVVTPIDGTTIATLRMHTRADVDAMIDGGRRVRLWLIPAPRRGELVPLCGGLRNAKDDLGALVTLESAKSCRKVSAKCGDDDICDFAVGLSRQLWTDHRIGTPGPDAKPGIWRYGGVITAFNFPVAPWCWNAALAFVCPAISDLETVGTPLSALATQKIFARAVARFDDAPPALSQLIIGRADIGTVLVESPGVASSRQRDRRMGRAVAPASPRASAIFSNSATTQ